MTVPLAHAGHWIANLLYAAPVLVVLGALARQRLRERRLRRTDAGPASDS